MNKLIVGTLAFALGAAAAPAAAQMRPFTIGIQGGPTLARGELAEEANTGYNVQGSLGLNIPLLPVGARADLLWQEFTDEQSGRFREVGGMVNGMLSLPLPLLRPYVLAGVGTFYHTSPESQHGDHAHAGGSETTFGWGAGAGLQIGLLGLGAVAEARYIDAGGEFQSIPLSIGIRF